MSKLLDHQDDPSFIEDSGACEENRSGLLFRSTISKNRAEDAVKKQKKHPARMQTLMWAFQDNKINSINSTNSVENQRFSRQVASSSNAEATTLDAKSLGNDAAQEHFEKMREAVREGRRQGKNWHKNATDQVSTTSPQSSPASNECSGAWQSRRARTKACLRRALCCFSLDSDEQTHGSDSWTLQNR